MKVLSSHRGGMTVPSAEGIRFSFASTPLPEDIITDFAGSKYGVKLPGGAEEQFTENNPWRLEHKVIDIRWPWRRLWKQWRKGWSYL